MKKIELTCIDCGLKRFSNGRNERCNPCATKAKYTGVRQQRLEQLQTLYDDVERADNTPYGKTAWTFTHRACGTRQTWSDSNITKQLDLRPNQVPCSKCGAAERTAKATAASAESRGIPDHLLTEWEAYRRKVRRLTEQTYRRHHATINPQGLKRGLTTWHLDHIVSIHHGFLNGIDPTVIAQPTNLRVITSFENISKGA